MYTYSSRRLFYTILFCTGLVYLLSVPSVNAAVEQIPDLGSPDLITYDKATEEQLGRAFTASLHSDFNLYDDLDTNHYIRQLGHTLSSYTGDNRHFAFYVIDDPSINAFAGPNGVIGIHTGLINAVETEDELAAVIAHEISHVSQNHLSRRYEYASSQGSLNSIATLLAAVLIGMYDPNAGMATLMGGMGYNLQQQLKNSRQHESEADAIGIQLLHQAGFNPHAMGDFFGRLSKANSTNNFQVPEILRTHPVSENRLAEAENRAAQLDYTDNRPDKAAFDLIKIKLNVRDKNNYKNKTNLTSQYNCYQQSATQPDKISPCLTSMVYESGSSPLYMTAYLAKLYANTPKLNKAEKKRLEKQANYLLALYPNNPSLLIHYAQYINMYEGGTKAIELLNDKIDRLSYQYHADMLLSQLYAKQQKQAHAYFFLAKAYMEIGNTARSRYYLEQSKKKENKNDKTLKAQITLFEQTNLNLLKNKDKNK